ncbi:MAG: squalene--hopene cyclase [Planctomycetaceae bacterium]
MLPEEQLRRPPAASDREELASQCGRVERTATRCERVATRHRRGVWLAGCVLVGGLLTSMATPGVAWAQGPGLRFGEAVPRDVREMYDRGLQFLASQQQESGEWPGGDTGPGHTGLCLLAFLASGEDPNFGLYASQVRKALRVIIKEQNAQTGYLGNSMYHHGFGMLALAEAYGVVDERTLWPTGEPPRSLVQALELAVRAAITSQKKNPLGAWRYSPDSNDADTSVAGAVLVGMLATRNAGLEVPDEAIDRALGYFQKMTSGSGQVAYSGLGFDDSVARVSIGSLVHSIARRKDVKEYDLMAAYLKARLEQMTADNWAEYTRYYQAQALFQADFEDWQKWNKLLIRQLKQMQQGNGSFRGTMGGEALDTSLSLLALALNYRFLPIYER